MGRYRTVDSADGARDVGLQPRARGWIEFVLGKPVVLWVGWPILRKFWHSFSQLALNMYTLIGLGVALAYLFSSLRFYLLNYSRRNFASTTLTFAFGYNALGIPLAAGVLYPVFGLLLSPIFAGAAMALSSVSVVTNALRLNRVKL